MATILPGTTGASTRTAGVNDTPRPAAMSSAASYWPKMSPFDERQHAVALDRVRASPFPLDPVDGLLPRSVLIRFAASYFCPCRSSSASPRRLFHRVRHGAPVRRRGPVDRHDGVDVAHAGFRRRVPVGALADRRLEERRSVRRPSTRRAARCSRPGRRASTPFQMRLIAPSPATAASDVGAGGGNVSAGVMQAAGDGGTLDGHRSLGRHRADVVAPLDAEFDAGVGERERRHAVSR